MKSPVIKRFVLLGVLVAVLMALAVWQSVTYNESRLVVPMDFSTYRFRPADLPMWIACGAVALYAIGLAVAVMAAALRRRGAAANHTRTLPRWLGFLGFLGLLGFLGIPGYLRFGDASPFVFFAFFGFFGFFYEAKMSNTLRDERFRENQLRAERDAYRVGFVPVVLALILLSQRLLAENPALTAVLLVVILSLDFALVIFLRTYLLYRYDCGDAEEGEA